MKIVLKCNRLAAVNLQAFEMKIDTPEGDSRSVVDDPKKQKR